MELDSVGLDLNWSCNGDPILVIWIRLVLSIPSVMHPMPPIASTDVGASLVALFSLREHW